MNTVQTGLKLKADYNCEIQTEKLHMLDNYIGALKCKEDD